MRVLVPVFIIGIICLTLYLLVWLTGRREARRKELGRTNHQLMSAEMALEAIQIEINLQTQAGYVDLQPIQEQVAAHYKSVRTVKEKLS